MRTRLLIVFWGIVFVSCKEREHKLDILPAVTAVYPSSDSLPENLLRMYIEFSKPMKTVGNLEHIKLFDDDGNEVVGAIFNNVQELWNNEQTQLTIIFDPARVKTGLVANETLGRALQTGRTYKLIIDGLEDIHHQKLGKPFVKKIHVIKADTQIPSIGNWKYTYPKSQTRKALVIQFPQPIDRQSLFHRLVITNNEKQPIAGDVIIKTNETEWHFVPDKVWEKGDYFLFVNARLEDPAGNNLNGLFEHEIGSLKNNKEDKTLGIQFKIK